MIKIKDIKIKIEKLDGQVGTLISMKVDEDVKMVAISPELDFKTLELLESAINKLFEAFKKDNYI